VPGHAQRRRSATEPSAEQPSGPAMPNDNPSRAAALYGRKTQRANSCLAQPVRLLCRVKPVQNTLDL
jgi:hypothetical protein